MESLAFCPAHITGFFKAHMKGATPEESGSLGAGFSIRDGVATRVRVSYAGESGHRIRVSGYGTGETRVSERVIDEFLGMASRSVFVDVWHEIGVPVGYGFGCSAAVALSLSMALNEALGTGLSREGTAQLAHRAELHCKTGLGDVLAAYHGGFEIRTRAGAPGFGELEKIDADAGVVAICFSPVSTSDFIGNRLESINGLGGKMVARLAESRNYDDFQDMSLEFARYVRAITPRMHSVIEELHDGGIKCGVAMVGETIFALVPRGRDRQVLDIFGRYPDGMVIRSDIDHRGARLQ